MGASAKPALPANMLRGDAGEDMLLTSVQQPNGIDGVHMHAMSDDRATVLCTSCRMWTVLAQRQCVR